MNAVVIITDTMRRDYLGLYGNRWVHTPHLDRFAERCVVFDRAYLASFPTMPMRADLCTGKFTFFDTSRWCPARDLSAPTSTTSGATRRTIALR